MVDKTYEAGKWLEFAQEDLEVATLILEKKLYNQVCFHSQQCVEKSLKAFLVKNNKKTPKVHSVTDLLKMCIQIERKEFRQFEDYVLILDQYYKPTRYPDAIIGTLPDGLPNEKDAAESLKIARTVYKFVNTKIA